MIRKLILVFIIIVVTLNSSITLSKSKPISILSTVRIENKDSGIVYPEIAVDPDGSWREATIKDLFIGQKFQAYSQTKNPQSIGKEVVINSLSVDYALFSSTNNEKDYTHYWGIYSSKQKFQNKGIGKPIKPEEINKLAQEELMKYSDGNAIEDILQKVVEYNWENIKNDFPNAISSNLVDFMIGDINGDMIKDFVLVLGGSHGGAVVISYIKNNGIFKRIPVSFWKNASTETSWPRLFFMKDFNGDGAEEVVITDSDSDINIPIIYSWFKDKGELMMIYQGKVEFWNG